jgi:hypothetical protein
MILLFCKWKVEVEDDEEYTWLQFGDTRFCVCDDDDDDYDDDDVDVDVDVCDDDINSEPEKRHSPLLLFLN